MMGPISVPFISLLAISIAFLMMSLKLQTSAVSITSPRPQQISKLEKNTTVDDGFIIHVKGGLLQVDRCILITSCISNINNCLGKSIPKCQARRKCEIELQIQIFKRKQSPQAVVYILLLSIPF